MPFGKGRLGSISNANAATNYTSLDALGNVLGSSQWVAGQTYTFGYTYNLAGSRATETYPSGRVMTTDYDSANRLDGVSGTVNGQTAPYSDTFLDAPHGGPAQYRYGNNVYRQISYNSRLQMSGYIDLVNNDPGLELLNVTLDWGGVNNNGNLRAATYKNGGPGYSQFLTFAQSYGYDRVNRLNSVSDTGYSRTFCSDAYGNVWVTANSGVPLAGNTPQMINGACPSSNTPYDANNRINGGNYDPAGNQTVVNGNTLAYDAENRLVSETDSVTHAVETYLYDGDRKRVQKTGPSGTTVFVYDVLGQLAAEYSTANSSFPCTTCYVSADHLGSTRLVTDSTGTVIARHDYLPFGEEIDASKSGRDSHWGPGNDTVNQKFTSKERDNETGLDYLGARYMSSAQGRFTSPDPLLNSGRPWDPQTWNRYSCA